MFVRERFQTKKTRKFDFEYKKSPKQSFIATSSMKSNNASAETSSCSSTAQRRPPSSSPPYEAPAPVPRLGVMSPLSLRHLLSFQQSPTMPWFDNADGTVTTSIPLIQLTHYSSPRVLQYQHQSARNRMVFLQSVLDEALNICGDVESIITSEIEANTTPAHTEKTNSEKQPFSVQK
jgi:hypothetical protein